MDNFLFCVENVKLSTELLKYVRERVEIMSSTLSFYDNYVMIQLDVHKLR